ncbi:hypothetical protein FHL15_008091 [Xylaria flabelliformis]|uniref:Uncharacterized protein n=1 Tax=Xylaria flabelliformis TaxID=2512241 RepID=A0A553HT31_9PEZI|nr:hypothetical protein FHL15_008091 [Xylaria flabelliformis]
MAETQVLARPISTWMSFANATITVPISSTTLSTTSDASPSPSITFLPTPTISTTIPPPTSSASTVSSSVLSTLPSSTLDLSTTSSLRIPTVAFSSSSTISSLMELIPDAPLVPISISSPSLPTSSVTSATIPGTSISQSTSNLPSFPGPGTAPIIPNLTPVDVSSPLSPPTQPNLNIPTPNPTSEFAPPPGGSHRTPPILMIIAIVISIFIFILLVTLLVLRQVSLRQHAQRRTIDIPITGNSSHSMASTYHSAHRGEVRIVISRPPGEARLWPVPPGHPSHYFSEPRIVTEREESGAADPNQWSVTSQDGSNSLPETRTGMGWGRASARVGVGRAY